MKVRVNQVLVYHPTAMDRIDGKTGLNSGDVVKVINVRGCPPANTMGHCYVGDRTTGKFIGMVSTNSLYTVKDWAEYQAKKSVLLTLQLLGATNAPKAAYANVKDGEAAFDALMDSGHIIENDGFYVLSETGRHAIK